MLRTLRARLSRIVLLGVSEDHDDQQRLQTAAISLIAIIVSGVTPIWVVTYVAIDRPIAAAIPGSYALLSIAMLLWLSRKRHLPGFVPLQMVLFAVLPVALQWSLGGFVNGSTVALWSFSAPLMALVVYGTRAAAWWFAVFVVGIVISVAFEPTLSDAIEAPPRGVQLSFFAINLAVPMLTMLIVLVYFVRQRDEANARTDELLGHILPRSIIERLKGGEAQIADRHEHATVLFADIVGFTAFSDVTPPERIVSLLSRAFVELDRLTARHGLEKIKTLGDGYLAVAGVTSPRADHAIAATAMALEVEPVLVASLADDWPEVRMRVGLASGPVMAGVIGDERFSFDVWGDTVNTASRMASHATPGGVQVTEETCAAIRDHYGVERREPVEVKGKGLMTMYVVLGPLAEHTAPAARELAVGPEAS